MKAVIYARYSSDGQRDESIDGQLRECKEYAERQNITIINTYIDRALSAKTDDRPEFQKMIRESSRKQFEVVLVWKLDRFARNRVDSATYRAILKRNGVRVVSAKENISEGPEGIILEAMLEGMAEYYSAELSVKVKRGQTENALKCKANGGMIPLGYKINSERYYEIDPITAPVVREIFERYADGKTVAEISQELSDKNAFIGTRYKYTNKSSIHNLLKNRKYIGEYCYGGHTQMNGMPAIISQDIFNRVQDRMGRNKHAPAAKKAEEEYILTTKLFCGKCGAMMVGTSGRGKSGKVHHYYKCSQAIYKKSCDKKSVRKAYIEQLVVENTNKTVSQNDVITRLADMIVEMQKKENTMVALLQKQLNDIDKRIQNLLSAIEDGLSNSSVKSRFDDLESKRADLEISIAKEKMEQTPLSKEQIAFWISRFKDGDIDNITYRRNIIDIFVNSVYLYDDKIMLVFNYKDGTKTITRKNINDSGVWGSYLDDNAPPLEKYTRLLF